MPHLPPGERLDRRLNRLAWVAVALMLVVVLASAWLRLAQPRPICHDWPGCRTATHAPGPLMETGPNRLLTLARAAHRGAASALLLVAIALTVLTGRQPTRDTGTRAHALTLLLLALALAVLGVVTPGSRAAPVLLGNQIGGLVMLALAWRLLRRLQLGAAPDQLASRPRRWPGQRVAVLMLSAGGALVWLTQAAVGALSGSSRHAGAPVAHLALALLALSLAAAAGWAAHRQGRRAEGGALLVLVTLQALLGAAAAGGAAIPPLVLAHAAMAAVGIALLSGLTAVARVSPQV